MDVLKCSYTAYLHVAGHTVFKLRKHSNEAVAKEATAVYTKWRSHFEEFQDRPQIEVKCDAKSQRIRDSGRKFLSEALTLEVCILRDCVGGMFPVCLDSQEMYIVTLFPVCLDSQEMYIVTLFPVCLDSQEMYIVTLFPVCLDSQEMYIMTLFLHFLFVSALHKHR